MAKVCIVFEDTNLETDEFRLDLEGLESDPNDENADMTMAEWMAVVSLSKITEFMDTLASFGNLQTIDPEDEDVSDSAE